MKKKSKTVKSAKNTKSPAKKAKKSAPKKNARMAADAQGDVLAIILDHHKPLKKLIRILKDSENDLSERKAAFEEFAPLLVSHAKAEEEVLYVFMKKEDELREEGFEGDVEHGLADQMLEEIKRTNDTDLWSARVKVVAELVEHHIEEEEGEMFKDIRKETEREQRVELGQQYMQKWEALLAKGGQDSPSEKAKPKAIAPALTHS